MEKLREVGVKMDKAAVQGKFRALKSKYVAAEDNNIKTGKYFNSTSTI